MTGVVGKARDDARRDFGIALSGGGVRAAAFALGALLYLVDSRLNRRVAVISSVSGASLTNGFLLAQGDDFGRLDQDSFDSIAKALIHRLARTPVMGGLTFALYALLLLSGLCCFSIALWSWPIQSSPLVRAALPFAWGAAFLFRGRIIESGIARFLQPAIAGSARPAGGPTLGRTRPSTSTTHVFCATDLVTQSPLFFVDHGGAWAYSRYGWAAASCVPIATAVRASAALPGAFPPRALPTTWLDPAASEYSETRLPEWLHLSDGGVWDNLGTQWFGPKGPPTSAWKDVTGKFPDAPRNHPPGEDDIGCLLVVDGRGSGTGFTHRSAQCRAMLLKIPLLSDLASLQTASSIQYENTVEPRTRAYGELLRLQMERRSQDGVLAGVATLTTPSFQPIESEVYRAIVRRPGDQDGTPNEAIIQLHAAMTQVLGTSLRAAEPDWLAGKSSPQPLHKLYERCARVWTKLWWLPVPDAMALVIHGYIQAMGACAALVAIRSAGPTNQLLEFPPLDRFKRLLPD